MTWMAIEGSFLGWTMCPGCSAAVVSTEDHADRAMCIDCGRDVNGVDWQINQLIGEWHPTVGYPDPYLGPDTSVHTEREKVPDMVLPDVTSRDPWPDDVRVLAPVVKLAALADSHGWSVEAPMYSRRGAEQLVSVRVRRAGLAGHAVYRSATGRSWAWAEFYVYADGGFPARLPLLADFSAVLIEGWKVSLEALQESLREMREIAANGAGLTKRRGKVREEIRRQAGQGAEWLAGQEWVAEFYSRDQVEKLLARPVGKRREGA